VAGERLSAGEQVDQDLGCRELDSEEILVAGVVL
jgi:hypothetical protein